MAGLTDLSAVVKKNPNSGGRIRVKTIRSDAAEDGASAARLRCLGDTET